MTAAKTFGERLSDLRAKRNETIKTVAKKVGIAASTLTEYENDSVGVTGKPKIPNYLTVKELANYYDVPYEYLFGDSECEERRNVDIAKETGLSEKAIKRIKEGLEVSKDPLCEWLNYSKTLSVLLENDAFCDTFFPNVFYYLDQQSRKSAFDALKRAGIVTETTDGSQMFLIGIQQAFTVLQNQLDRERRRKKGGSDNG